MTHKADQSPDEYDIDGDGVMPCQGDCDDTEAEAFAAGLAVGG